MNARLTAGILVGCILALCSGAPAGAQLNGIRIGVDPGHGGSAFGAVGPTGLKEKDVALSTALALRKYLVADGATVFMTRTTDVDVSFADRLNYYASNAVNRGVSVHYNSGSSSVNRTMDFVYCGKCFATAGNLASPVVQRVSSSTGITIGTPASTSDTLCSGRTDWSCGRTGVGQANLYMVREPENQAQIPSILVEVSYISNATEESRLRDPDYLDENGWSIYAGVADHYGVSPKPRTGSDTTGPTMSGVSATPNPTNGAINIEFQGTASDSGRGNSNIVAAELFFDSTGTNGFGYPMFVVDGSFNEPVEDVKAIYPTNGLTPGTKTVYLHAKDAAGNWGSFVSTTVTVSSSCSFSLSSPGQSFGSSGGSGSFTVTTQSGCSWSASSSASWITVNSGSGPGSGTVSYSVAANTGTSSRSGTITAGGQTFTVNQSGVSCSYSLSSPGQSFGSSGGSGSFTVTTQSGCSWSASSSASWITVNSGSGPGSGTVSYSVAANTGTSSRSGSITAGGQTFTVNQSGSSGETTPPDTSITGGPSGTANTGSVTFTYTGSDNVTPTGSLQYAYRLDPIEGGFSAFSSQTSRSYSGLANGNYTFYVKAMDQAGNQDSTPATRTFTVSITSGGQKATPSDLDGDGLSDWVVYRNGTWVYFGPCTHPLNLPGSAVNPACSSCAGEVCAADSFCCNTEWDEICVDEFYEICR